MREPVREPLAHLDAETVRESVELPDGERVGELERVVLLVTLGEMLRDVAALALGQCEEVRDREGLGVKDGEGVEEAELAVEKLKEGEDVGVWLLAGLRLGATVVSADFVSEGRALDEAAEEGLMVDSRLGVGSCEAFSVTEEEKV